MSNKTKSQRHAAKTARQAHNALVRANAEIALLQETLPSTAWIKRLMASRVYIRVIRQSPELQNVFADILDMVESVTIIALERDSETRVALWNEYKNNERAANTAESFDALYCPNFDIFPAAYERLLDEIGA